jgi:tRNA(Ile)-lysidine synthase
MRAAFAARLTSFRKVLAAVSGGPDSLALLDLARKLPDLEIVAATVDHGLRPEARDEIAVVSALCKDWRIPHRVLTIAAQPPVHGLQEWARQERYALLISAAEQEACDAVLVAHHQDDQAETLLHRLAAGTGPAGLSGMAMRVDRGRSIIVRPLLDVPKAALVAHCQAVGLPFVEDPSNGSDRFMRARLRRARTALEKEGLSSSRLATLAKRMARVNEALDLRAAELRLSTRLPDGALDWVRLRSEPAEIRLRVLKQEIESLRKEYGLEGPVSLERLEALLDTLAALPEGQRMSRTIAGLSLRIGTSGLLRLTAEPERKRGRKKSGSR